MALQLKLKQLWLLLALVLFGATAALEEEQNPRRLRRTAVDVIHILPEEHRHTARGLVYDKAYKTSKNEKSHKKEKSAKKVKSEKKDKSDKKAKSYFEVKGVENAFGFTRAADIDTDLFMRMSMSMSMSMSM